MSSSMSAQPQPCFRFSLAEIQFATRDFDEEMVVGEGGFGKVYKGCICIEETSHVVAVKRLDSMSNQGAPEFRAEIQMLSTLRHCHLVSLIGFCEDNKEMILVYEYMTHGTLYDHLHKADTPLSWMQRLKIAIGAARGLDYLHTGVGTKHGIIHRDVKSSNILLDENWAAMISDFGLSKIGPTNQSMSCIDASVKGTWGYLDPEYFYTTKLTRKTDVFAFGVVLFEVLSGRLAVDRSLEEDQCSLVRWAQKCVKERKLDQLVDSSIAGTIASKCLRRLAQTAYCCLNSDPKERPTMTEVVASLQALLELQKKFDISPESTSIMGLPWKIHEYLFSTTKSQNSDQSRTNVPKSHDKNMNQDEELVTRDVKIFTYAELKIATRNFGNDLFLGEGSYGEVYKGWVDQRTYVPKKHSDGLPIAVTKLHHYKRFDLEMLKEFRHPNLAKLIGYCLKGEQLFLVHEFLPNGNFEDLLRSGGVARLPLATKVKMAIGIARGIVFLHNTQFDNGLGEADRYMPRFQFEEDEPLLERHRILLDEDFTAKLSDYDVTKLVHGCFRSPDLGDSFDPDYYYPGYRPLHPQSSLSGFIVVFSEILTGKRISNFRELLEIDRLFNYDEKRSLEDIAILCFKKCNEVDSGSQMITILKTYDKLLLEKYDQLLQRRLRS